VITYTLLCGSVSAVEEEGVPKYTVGFNLPRVHES